MIVQTPAIEGSGRSTCSTTWTSESLTTWNDSTWAETGGFACHTAVQRVHVPSSRPNTTPRVTSGQRLGRGYRAAIRASSSAVRGRRQTAGSGVTAASGAVSDTHLRAHETDSYLVCRLLPE